MLMPDSSSRQMSSKSGPTGMYATQSGFAAMMSSMLVVAMTIGEPVDELAQRSLLLLARSGDDLTSALPGGHHGECDHGDQQRQPRPVDEFGQVRCQEHQINQQQSAAADHDQPQRRPPPGTGDVEEQQGGDGDRADHRHAERIRQRRRAAERETRVSTDTISTPLIHGT